MKEKLTLSGIQWTVLEKKEDKALVISTDALMIRTYDSDFTDETWESCTLREYLNGKFYDSLDEETKSRIIPTAVENPDNPWFGTLGGHATEDKLFLLSIGEVLRYFGGGSADGSGDGSADPKESEKNLPQFDFDGESYVPAKQGEGSFYSDEHDCDRKAEYKGTPVSWWLRSPGAHSGCAAFVYEDGGIGVLGLDEYAVLDAGGVAVRPAMWLTL